MDEESNQIDEDSNHMDDNSDSDYIDEDLGHIYWTKTK